MAESKRTFQLAKMNKDVDDRILPTGEYRDALNISVDTSEDANVGAIENLKGNHILGNQNILGLSAESNPNAEVIGSIVDPETDRVYYFVTGDKTDGIFEYDVITNSIHPVIVETSNSPATSTEELFTFEKSLSSGSVTNAGIILATSQIGELEILTENFGTVTSAQTKKVDVKVLTPNGYSNKGEYVYGQLELTQNPIIAPEVLANSATNILDVTATLNGKFTSNSAGITEVGFYWMEDTGGTTTTTYYSNEIILDEIIGNTAILSDGFLNWNDPFDGVPESDIIVKDSTGTTVASSTYTYSDYAGPRPCELEFTTLPSLPIKISQVSSGTTITDGRTAAEVQANGTQVILSSVTTPFSTDLTGLTADTKYIFIAYAINSVGTSLSEVVNFQTVTSSIQAPTFINPSVVGGNLHVTFSAQGNTNGGDPAASMYVVTSLTSGSVSAFTTAANTIRDGGTASGYTVTNFTGFTVGATTSAVVTVAASTTLYGLIFAENSAGRSFDGTVLSGTSNAAAVGQTALITNSNFTNLPTANLKVGGTPDRMTWSTQNGSIVPNSGNISFKTDPYNVNGNYKYFTTSSTVPTASIGGGSTVISGSLASRLITYSSSINDSEISTNPSITFSGSFTGMKDVPIPFINLPSGATSSSPSISPNNTSRTSIQITVPSGGSVSFPWGFSAGNNISTLSTAYIISSTGQGLGLPVSGTWSVSQSGNGGFLTWTDGGNNAGVYSSGGLVLGVIRMTKTVADAYSGNTQYVYPGGTVDIGAYITQITIT
jgi:hypothetical protein